MWPDHVFMMCNKGLIVKFHCHKIWLYRIPFYCLPFKKYCLKYLFQFQIFPKYQGSKDFKNISC